MNPSRDVFQAIADPTRRQIIHMLASKQMNVNSIAEQFDMSRQAVSLHVQYLSDCGLISIQQQGRERYCQANLDQLDSVTDWVNDTRKIWMHRFQALDKFLHENKRSKAKTKRSSHGK